MILILEREEKKRRSTHERETRQSNTFRSPSEIESNRAFCSDQHKEGIP